MPAQQKTRPAKKFALALPFAVLPIPRISVIRINAPLVPPYSDEIIDALLYANENHICVVPHQRIHKG